MNELSLVSEMKRTLRNTLTEYWLAEVPSEFTHRDVAVLAAGPVPTVKCVSSGMNEPLN